MFCTAACRRLLFCVATGRLRSFQRGETVSSLHKSWKLRNPGRKRSGGTTLIPEPELLATIFGSCGELLRKLVPDQLNQLTAGALPVLGILRHQHFENLSQEGRVVPVVGLADRGNNLVQDLRIRGRLIG